MKELAAGVSVLMVVGGLASWYFVSEVSAPPMSAPVPTTDAARPMQASGTETQTAFAIVGRDDLPGMKALLARFPDLVQKRAMEHGETLLHHAKSKEMAQLLIDAGADANATDRDFKARPIRWAVSDWNTPVALFLEQKAGGDSDVFYLAATGKSDALTAALLARPELLETLSGNDILGSSRHLMHIAATYGQAASTETLLKAGADVNTPGGWQDSQPLENAAWGGYPDVVKILIAEGADLEATDSSGHHTALWYAAVTGRTEIVKLLLNAGAKIEDGMILAVKDSMRRPYFGRALPEKKEYEAVVELLKARGGKE